MRRLRQWRSDAAADLRALSFVYELLARRNTQLHALTEVSAVLEDIAADLMVGQVGSDELLIFREAAEEATAAFERMIRVAAALQ